MEPARFPPRSQIFTTVSARFARRSPLNHGTRIDNLVPPGTILGTRTNMRVASPLRRGYTSREEFSAYRDGNSRCPPQREYISREEFSACRDGNFRQGAAGRKRVPAAAGLHFQRIILGLSGRDFSTGRSMPKVHPRHSGSTLREKNSQPIGAGVFDRVQQARSVFPPQPPPKSGAHNPKP